MKTSFKDPVKEEKHSTIKNFWNFNAPVYDERSSCFMNAGTIHGVGHKQPVGHEGNPKTSSPSLPMGRVNTMRIDEV